jgi:hypothetical protein
MRRLSCLLACLAAATTLLTACGGSAPPKTTQPASSCQPSAAVSPGPPLDEAQPPHSRMAVISSVVPLTCGTILTVLHRGNATARYGSSVLCELEDYDGQNGKLFSRDPRNAYFTLATGQVVCTFDSPQFHQVPICGEGTLYLNGNADFAANCDPSFSVLVERGVVRVAYPGRAALSALPVRAGEELKYNAITGSESIIKAKFTGQEMLIFDVQSREL